MGIINWIKSLKKNNKDNLLLYYNTINYNSYETLNSLFNNIEDYNNYLKILIDSDYSIEHRIFINNNSYKNLTLVSWVNKGNEFLNTNKLFDNVLAFIKLGREVLEYKKLSPLHFHLRDNIKDVLMFLERRIKK